MSATSPCRTRASTMLAEDRRLEGDHSDAAHLRRHRRPRARRLEGRRASATSFSPISANATPSPMSCAASRTATSPMSRAASIRSRDIETIETELMLADLESLERRVVALEKKAKGGDKEAKETARPRSQPLPRRAARGPARRALAGSRAARSASCSSRSACCRRSPCSTSAMSRRPRPTRATPFRTRCSARRPRRARSRSSSRPRSKARSRCCRRPSRRTISRRSGSASPASTASSAPATICCISSPFSPSARRRRAPGRSRRARKAPQAAGVIHTDFEKGFIRAETIAYDDYVALQGRGGRARGRQVPPRRQGLRRRRRRRAAFPLRQLTAMAMTTLCLSRTFRRARSSNTAAVEVTAEDIVAFAREFDPQPFHLDEEAARESATGGLIASGWHTGALLHRMNCDAFLAPRDGGHGTRHRRGPMGAPGASGRSSARAPAHPPCCRPRRRRRRGRVSLRNRQSGRRRRDDAAQSPAAASARRARRISDVLRRHAQSDASRSSARWRSPATRSWPMRARFDPRILAAAREGGPVAAAGLHVASAMMRRLVETRDALRAEMAALRRNVAGVRRLARVSRSALAPSRMGGRRRLLRDGDHFQARDFEAELGARRQQLSRRQSAWRRRARLLERRPGRPQTADHESGRA